MRVAQSLYENGYITYMRTDSVHLSEQAITAARECVRAALRQGATCRPSPGTIRQERARAGSPRGHPAGGLALPDRRRDRARPGGSYDLYDLIWKRTVACQMADARITSVRGHPRRGRRHLPRHRQAHRLPRIPPRLRGGQRRSRSGARGPGSPSAPLAVGDAPACVGIDALSSRNPAAGALYRSEPGEGARGRRHRAAQHLRQHHRHHRRAGLRAEAGAGAGADLHRLRGHRRCWSTTSRKLVDLKFTAKMEEQLDEIAEGQAEWLPYLQAFLSRRRGPPEAGGDAGKEDRPGPRADGGGRRIGRRHHQDRAVRPVRRGGARRREALRASFPRDSAPADLTMETVEEILRQKREGPDVLGESIPKPASRSWCSPGSMVPTCSWVR